MNVESAIKPLGWEEDLCLNFNNVRFYTPLHVRFGGVKHFAEEVHREYCIEK